jgi:hypothetical protein
VQMVLLDSTTAGEVRAPVLLPCIASRAVAGNPAFTTRRVAVRALLLQVLE